MKSDHYIVCRCHLITGTGKTHWNSRRTKSDCMISYALAIGIFDLQLTQLQTHSKKRGILVSFTRRPNLIHKKEDFQRRLGHWLNFNSQSSPYKSRLDPKFPQTQIGFFAMVRVFVDIIHVPEEIFYNSATSKSNASSYWKNEPFFAKFHIFTTQKFTILDLVEVRGPHLADKVYFNFP